MSCLKVLVQNILHYSLEVATLPKVQVVEVWFSGWYYQEMVKIFE